MSGESRTASHEILITFQTFLCQNGVDSTQSMPKKPQPLSCKSINILVFSPDSLVILNEDSTFKRVEKGILQKFLLEPTFLTAGHLDFLRFFPAAGLLYSD